jgi:tetratricopeptide (TPR) repeat protein
MLVYYLRDPDEGERLCRQARTWFERTDDTYFQVQNLVSGLATFALTDDRPGEAEAWLREALPVALLIGGWVLMDTYRYLAEALVAQDRLEDAADIVAFAARTLSEDDPYSRCSLLMAEAVVATAAGESAAAATSFAEALRLFEDLNIPLDLAEARLKLGKALLSFGDYTGARAELERARAIFTRIGAATRQARVDAELVELVEGPTHAGPSTM